MSASSSILRLETPRVFVPLLEPARYKGAFGGRGSAKSHFFAEALVERCLLETTRAVCIRENQKSLRESVKALIEDKIKKFGVQDHFRVLTTHIEVKANGGRIIFQGMQSHTADSIKSLEGYDIAWVEEAQVLSKRSLTLLRPTLRKEGSELWFSWNPQHKTDPIDQLLRGDVLPPRAIVVESNWRDNPWFPKELREEMEFDRKRDKDLFAHVWEGGYIVHSDAQVFKNWEIGVADVPEGSRPYYGADWGFAVDPTVLARCYITGPRKLYIDAEVYKVGCEIDRTPALFDGLDEKAARQWPITADSARPETISYMQKHGYPHIKGAIKGPGSLEDGIEFLKSYDITVHPDCKHTIAELTYYSYKLDKITEEVLPVLEDKNNNVIDAVRYAVEGVRMATVGEEAESSFVFEPRQMSRDWPRVYAVDVKGAQVSVVWGAWDVMNDTVYLYGEYSESRARIEVWASAIRKRGEWIPGVFDALARRRNQDQGDRLHDRMLDEHLDISVIEVDAEAGAEEMNARIATSQLKVCETMTEWFAQYRSYMRDKKGDIVEENEGLIKATGVLLVSGLSIAMVEQGAIERSEEERADETRNQTTGY